MKVRNIRHAMSGTKIWYGATYLLRHVWYMSGTGIWHGNVRYWDMVWYYIFATQHPAVRWGYTLATQCPVLR
eukprot:1207753-Rhodomonas_salina.1